MAYALAMATILQYIQAAMEHAHYEKMEDGEWFASIPGFAGLWASGRSVETARKELLSALDGWIEISTKTGHRLPDLDGLSLYDDLTKVAEN
jgi:predicted RNase H-like HicB family nuclease